MKMMMLPCNFDHNGECLICDCWPSDCAYKRYLAEDYSMERKELLERMFKDYNTMTPKAQILSIELHEVGYPYPTRHDIVGVYKGGKRHFMGWYNIGDIQRDQYWRAMQWVAEQINVRRREAIKQQSTHT
jgi:hypothetical protein